MSKNRNRTTHPSTNQNQVQQRHREHAETDHRAAVTETVEEPTSTEQRGYGDFRAVEQGRNTVGGGRHEVGPSVTFGIARSAIEIAKVNANVSLEMLAFGARAFTRAFEMQSEFARGQFEAFRRQARRTGEKAINSPMPK